MPAARPFMDLLREHRNGAFHDEISDALQELIGAITSERKAGTLVISFGFRPSSDGAVNVSATVKTTPPKATVGESLFFVTPENNLIRDNPRQPKLPLQALGDRAEPERFPDRVPAREA